MVELVENFLHPISEELKGWQSIIGEHYIDHKLEEERNRLLINPKGTPLLVLLTELSEKLFKYSLKVIFRLLGKAYISLAAIYQKFLRQNYFLCI